MSTEPLTTSSEQAQNDASFGVVALRYSQGLWWILLVQHKQGHWAFPKGHPDPDESNYCTASRELWEETHCRVLRFLDMAPLVETYHFRNARKAISKTVTYFVAEVDGDARPQPEELREVAWVPLQEAPHQVTFPLCRDMCRQVYALVVDKSPCQLRALPNIRVHFTPFPTP